MIDEQWLADTERHAEKSHIGWRVVNLCTAYRAVLAERDDLKAAANEAHCSFCGWKTTKADIDGIAAHMTECEKHPLQIAASANRQLIKTVEGIHAEYDAMKARLVELDELDFDHDDETSHRLFWKSTGKPLDGAALAAEPGGMEVEP